MVRYFALTCVTQMLMDPMGGIVMTNDGNAILREVCNFSLVCWLLFPFSKASEFSAGKKYNSQTSGFF